MKLYYFLRHFHPTAVKIPHKILFVRENSPLFPDLTFLQEVCCFDADNKTCESHCVIPNMMQPVQGTHRSSSYCEPLLVFPICLRGLKVYPFFQMLFLDSQLPSFPLYESYHVKLFIKRQWAGFWILPSCCCSHVCGGYVFSLKVLCAYHLKQKAKASYVALRTTFYTSSQQGATFHQSWVWSRVVREKKW